MLYEVITLNTVPYSKNAEEYLKFALTGNYRDLNQPESDYKKNRCTNLALSGLLFDNNFFPLSGWSLSLGFLGNGSVRNNFV